ncbi:MAG: MOSC domain-containing protein [Geminicoccaceae bacterium]
MPLDIETMQIGSLAVYPIKGVQAVALKTATVEAKGLLGDRRWMLVDADGRFITQREEPRLATIKAELSEDGLIVDLPGEMPIQVVKPDGSRRASVQVWRTVVDAALADEAVNERLSAFFGRFVRLVFMDKRASRFANPDWAGDDAHVSFADGYPILLTTTASLVALNDTIDDNGGAAVSMDRFRPNIVVDGASPWEEDGWAVIQVGELVFDLVKPCTRCIVPTFDQVSGEPRSDNQPTRALTKTRRSADERVRGVLFGWNVIARTEGMIHVGDAVNVLEGREAWPIRSG